MKFKFYICLKCFDAEFLSLAQVIAVFVFSGIEQLNQDQQDGTKKINLVSSVTKWGLWKKKFQLQWISYIFSANVFAKFCFQ